MTDITTYLENQLQTWWANGTAFDNAPANVYVGLHTGDPGDAAANNEVGAADYSRLQTAPADWTVSGGAPTKVENATELQFPEATNNWGTISHVSLWTADVGSVGDPLFEGALNTSRTINSGDRLVFPTGDLNVEVD